MLQRDFTAPKAPQILLNTPNIWSVGVYSSNIFHIEVVAPNLNTHVPPG